MMLYKKRETCVVVKEMTAICDFSLYRMSNDGNLLFVVLLLIAD